MQFLQLCLLRSKSSSKSSSGQKIPQKVLPAKMFLEKFLWSKSSSPFSIAEWGFEGCPLLTVVSIPWAILALFYTSLYTFFPFSSCCYFVACDFLVVSDCFCFLSQARSVSNFGSDWRGNVADRLGHIGRPLDHPRCSCLRKSLAVRDALAFCSSNRLFSAWSRLPIKTTSGFRDPKKVLAIEIFSGIYFWSKLQNMTLVHGISLQKLDYWLLLFV